MRRTLRLLLLLGIGLALAGKKPGGGDSTPGGGDNDDDPLTGRPKDSDERKERLDFQGKNASTEMAEVHDTADTEAKTGRAGDSDGDGQPDLSDTPALPSRADLPPLNISPKQFGKKWGKHAKDYGLDPGDPDSRQQFMDLAQRVHSNPDDVRVGPYNPNGGGGPDYVFYRQGDDLVIMKPNGDFVTMFPMDPANPNGWYQGATSIQ
jgi:hypothetical protein